MGFTPLEGLVMATRAGNTDPGLLVWLLQDGRVSLDELSTGLEQRSGLAGLAGQPDIRDVLPRADRGDPAAILAVNVYLHRLRQLIAGMAAAMDGLDVLLFTGGVGEHQPPIRARAAPSFLGAAIDEAAASWAQLAAASSMAAPRKLGAARAGSAAVLADAPGEDQGVQTAESRGHGGDLAPQPVDVDGQRQDCGGGARGGAGQDLAHVAGAAGEPGQADSCSSTWQSRR